MRKLVLLPIIAILAISIGVNSVLLIQQTGKLGEISSGIDSLGGKVSTLTGDVSTLQGNLSGLQGSVASLQGGVSILQGNVSSLQVKLTNSEAKISTLQADLIKATAEIAKVQAVVNTQQTIPLAEVIKSVAPTVVRIGTSRGSGSGIIINRTGYVLTAEHVVSNVTSATISLASGERYSGSLIIARDTQRDLAIIKINSTRTDFRDAVLGSSANTSIGDKVFTAGYGNGFDHLSISEGIVSAFHAEDGLNYIQTDAAINPGNSGGALFDLRGQVIGITVAKYVNVNIEGVGLAIPIDETKTFIQSTVK